MRTLNMLALATAATIAVWTGAEAQDAGMQGHGAEASMPDACMKGAAPAGHDMGGGAGGSMDSMGEHQSAMMQGMMATSDQMMQGVMADDPDVAFACGMIPHHQAAINMAEVELEYGDDQTMKDMAQTIIDAQTKEIEELTSWIEKSAQ
jgi:uncharacterized protein (DUF305 family)